MNIPRLFLPAGLALAAACAGAGSLTQTEQSTRLYTPPDPAAAGGIRVAFQARGEPMGVFALLQTDVNKCYAGASAGGAWTFKGLPVGKYDLVAVFEDRFYEGLLLTRETNALAAADVAALTAIVDRSVPFFDTKKVHRAAGSGGKGGKAAIVLQEVRTRPVLLQSGEERSDIQVRSLKAAFLEEVNIGWQLVRTREIMRIEVGGAMPKGLISHTFVKGLGNIRVTDAVKDLGAIRLD